MAETDTTEATEPTAPDPERFARLEDKVDRLADLVAKIVPSSHAEAQQRTEDRLDRGTAFSEAVAAEVERATQAKAEQQARADADAADKAERQEMRELAAKLREKPPAPPRNPLKDLATKGWGDGR